MSAPQAVATIIPRSYDGMTLAVAPAEAHRRIQELRAFVQSTMVRNEDYGVIPGTDKPTLYQPGAQKLAEIYGLAHTFEVIDSVKDWERGFFYFEYRTVLTSRRDGRHVCDGIGSCNSRESKYGARWCFEGDVPEGMQLGTLKTKQITSKKPGPNKGKTFTMYQIPNPDIYSIVNTLQKMACKRSYVHAVIAATRSAGLFTQDVEDQDIPDEAFGEVEPTRSWEDENADDASATIAAKLRAAITAAKSIEDLRTAWGGVGVAFRSKWIDPEQYATLTAARDARIVELGGTPPPKGEPAKPATVPAETPPTRNEVMARKIEPQASAPQTASTSPEEPKKPAAASSGQAKEKAPAPTPTAFETAAASIHACTTIVALHRLVKSVREQLNAAAITPRQAEDLIGLVSAKEKALTPKPTEDEPPFGALESDREPGQEG